MDVHDSYGVIVVENRIRDGRRKIQLDYMKYISSQARMAVAP